MVLMLDPFQLPFMQRAALEVVLLAPIAGVLGAQIVLRNLAFFTHGVGAATFPGLVVAGPAGIPPALAALAIGGGFAALLERLGRRAGLAYDVATALLLVAALAIGIVLASDVFESGSGVDQLLFGSLLAIGTTELLVTAATLVAVLAAAALCRRAWIAAGFDALGGGALGLRVVLADGVLIAAVAIAAIASLDAVGALLVSAVLVIPAATARLFAPSVVALEIGGAVLALVEGLAGLLIAYRLDVPPGAVIAVIGGIVFAICLTARELPIGGTARSTATEGAA
jgi:manganese/iron transport system permease protein